MAEQDERVLDETEVDDAAQSSAEQGKTEQSNTDDEYARTMDRVEAALNEVAADKKAMTPQMRKMFARQQESTRRVEESIKGTKSNPRWFVPLLCALLIIGLIWVVVYYLNGTYPIPGIGDWNLAIGFAIMLVGFLMTMWWH